MSKEVDKITKFLNEAVNNHITALEESVVVNNSVYANKKGKKVSWDSVPEDEAGIVPQAKVDGSEGRTKDDLKKLGFVPVELEDCSLIVVRKSALGSNTAAAKKTKGLAGGLTEGFKHNPKQVQTGDRVYLKQSPGVFGTVLETDSYMGDYDDPTCTVKWDDGKISTHGGAVLVVVSRPVKGSGLSEGETREAIWYKKYKHLVYFDALNSSGPVHCDSLAKAKAIIDKSGVEQTLKIDNR